MPNVTEAKIDLFVKELKACITEHGPHPVNGPESPLALLSSAAWGSEAMIANSPGDN